MIGVVLATHASFGQGIIDAVELIAGKQTNVIAIGLQHGDSVQEFEMKVYAALESLDEGDGVLGFIDFFGGTPSNIMMYCMQKKKFPCITGANMPMLTEALTNRDNCTVWDLEKNCLEKGKESLFKLEDIFAKMTGNEPTPETEDF